jgi:hypothetical protein
MFVALRIGHCWCAGWRDSRLFKTINQQLVTLDWTRVGRDTTSSRWQAG